MKRRATPAAVILAWSAVATLSPGEDATQPPEPSSESALAEKIDAYLTEAEDQVSRLAVRLRELRDADERSATLEDALAKVTRQKSVLENELAERQRRLDEALSLTSSLNQAHRDAAAYREETERLRQDLRRQRDVLAVHRDALSKVTRQKAEREAEAVALERAAEARAAETNGARESLETARAEASKLAEMNVALSRSEADLRQELEATNEREAELARAHASTKDALAETQERLKTASNEVQQLRLVESETAAALAQAREKWLQTEKTLTKGLNAEQETRAALAAEVQQLRTELAESRRLREATVQESESRFAALSESRAELARTQEKLLTAEDALQAANRARANWIEKHEKATEELQAARNDADAWKLQFTELQKRLADAQTESLKLRQAEETLILEREATRVAEQKAEALAARLAEANDRVQALESGAASTRETVTALKEDVAARERELSAARSRLSEKEAEWAETRNALESGRNALESKLETLRSDKEALLAQFLRIEPVRYELNSARIDEEQERVLSRVKKILAVFPEATFGIAGHTCNLGTEDDNKQLSEQRAQRLLDFLAANGVAAAQMQAEGFGESRPVADNETDTGRRRNRRVEIQVTSTGTPAEGG